MTPNKGQWALLDRARRDLSVTVRKGTRREKIAEQLEDMGLIKSNVFGPDWTAYKLTAKGRTQQPLSSL